MTGRPDPADADVRRGRWLPYLRPGGPAEVRLFCLPYAGGAATLFQRWRRSAPEWLEVQPTQPPGRRERLREAPLTSAAEMAEQVGEAMLPALDRPYALFGISMGALVAFETAHWLTARGRPPRHLFVASCRTPRQVAGLTSTGDRTDAELVELLGHLRSTPPEVLADEEMRRMLLPAIRADFAVTETYVYRERPRLDAPVAVLRGTADPLLSAATARAWRDETDGPCHVYDFDSGHFLLPEFSDRILRLVADVLDPRHPALNNDNHQHCS